MKLDLSRVDRVTALRTWLAYNGLDQAQLARELGVAPSFLSLLFQGKRRSRRIIADLVERGVPEELLPAPGNGPGRPKRARNEDIN